MRKSSFSLFPSFPALDRTTRAKCYNFWPFQLLSLPLNFRVCSIFYNDKDMLYVRSQSLSGFFNSLESQSCNCPNVQASERRLFTMKKLNVRANVERRAEN